MRKRTCVLVDDSAIIREGLRLRFSAYDFEIVGEAADGASGFELIREQRADVALLDVRMPRGDGLWVLEQLAEEERANVMLLSAFGDALVVDQALALGAAGFVLKGADASTLERALDAASRRHSYIDPDIVNELVVDAPGGLEETERAILRLVGTGSSLEGAGAALGIELEDVRKNFDAILGSIDGYEGVTGRLRSVALDTYRRGDR